MPSKQTSAVWKLDKLCVQFLFATDLLLKAHSASLNVKPQHRLLGLIVIFDRVRPCCVSELLPNPLQNLLQCFDRNVWVGSKKG